MRQLKSGEIQEIREEILEEQGGLCAICGNPILEDDGIALDHQHKTSKEVIGEDGAGLIRGVLHRSCNVWEGRLWNITSRYMQPENVQDRIDMLKSLIEYYEKENYPLVHPNEKPKERTVSKKNYNKLKKEYSGKRKFPEYPKSGKLTIGLQALFEEYGIEPYN